MTSSNGGNRSRDTASRTIGQRLKELRTRRGLSQTELASGIVSPSAISLLESDRRQPNQHTLELLATRLKSTSEYLRYGTEPGEADHIRLDVLTAEIWLFAAQHNMALELFDAALRTRRLSPYLTRRARLGRAIALEHTGQITEAIAELEEMRGGRDREELSWLDTDAVLSRCYRSVGRHRECLALAIEAVGFAESVGLHGLANHSKLVTNLIHELHEQSRIGEAVDVARRHLGSPLIPAKLEPAVGYRNASVAAATAGHIAEALLMAERALAAYEAVADARDAALLRTVAAIVLMADEPGSVHLALSALRESHDVLKAIGTSSDLVFCEMGLAGAAMQQDDPQQAIRWAEQALARGSDDSPRVEHAFALTVLSRGYHVQGTPDQARHYARRAHQVLQMVPSNRRRAIAWRELGDVLRTIGDHEAALNAYESALDSVQVVRVFEV